MNTLRGDWNSNNTLPTLFHFVIEVVKLVAIIVYVVFVGVWIYVSYGRFLRIAGEIVNHFSGNERGIQNSNIRADSTLTLVIYLEEDERN